MPYRQMFELAGLLMLVAAVLASSLSHHACTKGERQRVVWRAEYRDYYLLTFLEGCRRQIFTTFAPFVLIMVFHTSVQAMLVLVFVNAVLNMICAPQMGRWMDRYGERVMLTIYYVSLMIIFAGYAHFQDIHTLYGLYLVDNVLNTFSLGITLHLNRIVRPGDLTPSLAMGTTMNHVAAVLVPVAGGLLWKAADNYRIPFWIGIAVAVWSLYAVSRLPRHAVSAPAPAQ